MSECLFTVQEMCCWGNGSFHNFPYSSTSLRALNLVCNDFQSEDCHLIISLSKMFYMLFQQQLCYVQIITSIFVCYEARNAITFLLNSGSLAKWQLKRQRTTSNSLQVVWLASLVLKY